MGPTTILCFGKYLQNWINANFQDAIKEAGQPKIYLATLSKNTVSKNKHSQNLSNWWDDTLIKTKSLWALCAQTSSPPAWTLDPPDPPPPLQSRAIFVAHDLPLDWLTAYYVGLKHCIGYNRGPRSVTEQKSKCCLLLVDLEVQKKQKFLS